MRGKVSVHGVSRCHAGITPAYAGKSRPQLLRFGLVQDHPRLCGEKCAGNLSDLDCFRITPAYAGKRPFAVDETPAGWDHPRLCGEKSDTDHAIS